MTAKPVLVNVDNFVRAESDRMLEAVLRDSGGINRGLANRVPTPLDHQTVIRQNRDTLYSGFVVDVSQGARLTIPETGRRYASAMVINQDHFVPFIFHKAGVYDLTEQNVGTGFALIGIRVLVNPDDPSDVATVNVLQDQFLLEAGASRAFTQPDYDAQTFTKTREHLIALSLGLSDYRGAFGLESEVDPVRHLLASASAWGGFPEREAMYLNVDPKLPVGNYSLTVHDVPVDGFWSVTVYNADGYMEPNDRGVVSVNSVTAVPNADGSVTVHFGEGDLPNTIPVTENWNYLVRLYQPREEVLSGGWKFPSVG